MWQLTNGGISLHRRRFYCQLLLVPYHLVHHVISLCDIPDGSPKVPHRLLTYKLIEGFQVCIICGPTPSLMELEREVISYWKPVTDSLTTMCKVHPQNYPSHLNLDPAMLGFILKHVGSNRSLCTVHTKPQRTPGELLDKSYSRTLLLMF